MVSNQERKIPVLTVLKNGTILKNIFLISQQPPPSPQSLSVTNHVADIGNSEDACQEEEEILTVGRHPDCSIFLTHPSISRFHLQISSRPSSEKLSVTDLSSVHGTWVSETRIQPGVSVELREGDTIRLGGSTRVYRLHWIPLSSAYDSDQPLVPPMDVPMAEEDEGSLSETNQDHENLQPAENEDILSSDLCLERIGPVFFVEKSKDVLKKEIPSAPPLPENIACSTYEGSTSTNIDVEMEIAGICSKPCCGVSMELFHSVAQIMSEIVIEQLTEDRKSLQNTGFTKPKSEEENSEKSSPAAVQISDCLVSGSSALIVEDKEDALIAEKSSLQEEIISEISTQKVDKQEQASLPLSSMQSQAEIKNETNATMGHQLKEEKPNYCCASVPQSLVKRENNEDDAESRRLTLLPHSPSKGMVKDADIQSLSTEKYGSENTSCYESVHSSFHIGGGLSEVEANENSETPESLSTQVVLPELENFENYSFLSEEKSRRGKPASAIRIQTARSTGKASSCSFNFQKKSISRPLFSDMEDMEEEIFTPDKENLTPNTLLLRSLKREEKLEDFKEVANSLSLSNSKISSSLNAMGENTNSFSDKEKLTPDALLMRSLKRKGKLGEVKNSANTLSSCSPKKTPTQNNELEVDVSALSDKENQTLEVLGERKPISQAPRNLVQLEEEEVRKSGGERVPFQSLPLSSGKIKSEVKVADGRTRCSSSFAYKMSEKRTTESLSDNPVAKRGTWTMVVDTTSLLDKRTWKSLQLLQGLKRTQLIVPRMVIRELDYLKQQGSLFRRITEASSVLEWIEDCMTNTKWWIHVQSSMEEGRLVAPTPPATPQSQLGEGNESTPRGSTCSFLPSAWGSGLDIASPTAEDHILDSALKFRRMKDTQQLVLLSNDITLKIKAMAEGLICETAKEFRDSLVNPFSERFLWADSSPRGHTWSCLDDAALREKYNGCPAKKSSKGEGAKGLKLILLHNSQYRISSVR